MCFDRSDKRICGATACQREGTSVFRLYYRDEGVLQLSKLIFYLQIDVRMISSAYLSTFNVTDILNVMMGLMKTQMYAMFAPREKGGQLGTP